MKPIKSIASAAAATLALLPSWALAKLPPPSDAAKAKSAETAAKTAHDAKVDSYKLCQAQDRVAAAYRGSAAKAGTAASAAVETPPCTDPGSFAYSPPPLESSGAHSPAKTADGPPSSTVPAAVVGPQK